MGTKFERGIYIEADITLPTYAIITDRITKALADKINTIWGIRDTVIINNGIIEEDDYTPPNTYRVVIDANEVEIVGRYDDEFDDSCAEEVDKEIVNGIVETFRVFGIAITKEDVYFFDNASETWKDVYDRYYR